jgi:ribosome biogenesis GTPase
LSATNAATVVAGFGRQLLVVTEAGAQMTAVTRGRNAQVAVGDRVRITQLGAGQVVIESVEARRNEFKRSDGARSKVIAANLDQAGVVIAPYPPFSEDLLLRVLIAAGAEDIPIALVVNKRDLLEARAAIEPRIASYRALGYRIIDCAARTDPEGTREALQPWLAGRRTLLLGQSGMGKSTLINCLVPDAGLRTREISEALGSGRHTTTFTRMFTLPGAGNGVIIDSPGFQGFGLEHLSMSERVHAMPEFAALLGRCRFHNCTHRDEPGCAIRAAVKEGAIDPLRYQLFVRLTEESGAIARGFPRRG